MVKKPSLSPTFKWQGVSLATTCVILLNIKQALTVINSNLQKGWEHAAVQRGQPDKFYSQHLGCKIWFAQKYFSLIWHL